MTELSWGALLTAGISGGLAVKLLELGFQSLSAWRKDNRESTKSVDTNLEPLLHAADELVGKLRSLAEQDFIPVRDADAANLDDVAFASVVYLFVQFWSEFQIVRFRGLSTAIASSGRGKQTQAFLNCLESRSIRLIDRISQRAVGEAALLDGRTMNFVEFMKAYDADPYMRRWLEPLTAVLSDVRRTSTRQRILQYYTVIHSLVDTLDKHHLVTKKRPAAPNKLNTKSWRDLNFRVFDVYLPFVKDREKYIGPPNRRP